MKFESIGWAFFFALFASVGNALVAYGQKKSVPHDNPFLVGAGAFFIGSIVLSMCALFFQTRQIGSVLIQNGWWCCIIGLGYAILTMGMYFLYRNFGTPYYTLYAVLSIIVTSILLAIFVFDEKLSVYHLLSILCAFLTIAFFFIGKENGKQ